MLQLHEVRIVLNTSQTANILTFKALPRSYPLLTARSFVPTLILSTKLRRRQFLRTVIGSTLGPSLRVQPHKVRIGYSSQIYSMLTFLDTALPQPTAPPEAEIPPPPNGILYSTTEDAIAAMNAFAKPYGFAISTMSCTSWNGTKQIVYLCCRRERISRNLRPPGAKRAGSDCPFACILRLQPDGRWLATLPHGTHNHGVYTGPAHIIHRRTEIAQKAALIDAQIRNGKGPTAIFRFLRDEDPTTCILVQDVKAYRKKALNLAAREQALSTPDFMGPYQVTRPG